MTTKEVIIAIEKGFPEYELEGLTKIRIAAAYPKRTGWQITIAKAEKEVVS